MSGDAHRRSGTLVLTSTSDDDEVGGLSMVPPPLPPPSMPPSFSSERQPGHAPNLSIRGMMAASGAAAPPVGPPPPLASSSARATGGAPSPLPPDLSSSTSSRANTASAPPNSKKLLTAQTAKSAKRRATNAFLIDPTMSNTLQQVKAKADAANVAERISTGADSSAAELEEIELQMLRGIFAAHDENKDGVINKSQLAEALVSLGYSPTEKLMTKFFLENAKTGKKHWRINLETFLSAASKWLDSAEDCSADVMYLFEMFDKTKSGSVSAQVVRHLLHEAVTPTRLTRQETEEFMKYSDVGGGKVGKMRLKAPVDYEDLVDKLMF